MRTNICLSPGWRGALRLVLIVLLLALSAAAVPADWAENGAAAAPLASAAIVPPLLQFTAGGHVIGFAPTQVILAAFDHALRVEFVGTAGVAPVAVGAEAAASDGGLTMGRAQPLGVVTYPDLWRGISVEYRADEGGIVKSTYTVAPGADAAQIRLRYNVPVELQSDGSLQFRFGRGVMIESAPLAWQEIDGRRVFVPVAFYLPSPDRRGAGGEVDRRGAGGEVAFRLGAYDPRYPLTIDPNYVWHTFYGALYKDDTGSGIAVDGIGNVYITGDSWDTWQGDNNTPPLHPYSGSRDIFVVKLNSAGTYQWHTFYGSSNLDWGTSIAVDASGNVYITGYSYATWQGDNNANPLHAHSGGDIFVLKLTSAGAYQWHTFYGSSILDEGLDIAVDTSGNVYITGYSWDTWQGDNNTNPLHVHSGGYDILVLKLNSAGGYQWHTFYGSAKWEEGIGIAVDGSSSVYITGEGEATWWGDNGTPPLHGHTGGTNNDDIFVLKLNSAGGYQWHTFYGAADQWDAGRDIAVDGSGNVYISGFSFAIWQGDGGTPPKHTPGVGGAYCTVLKLNSGGAYQWHTFYEEDGESIAVDGDNVYIAGRSWYPWQGDNNTPPLHPHSKNWDILALKLNSDGEYQWHTFYGSNDDDMGNAIAVDGSGNLYIAGESEATWRGDNNTNPLHTYSGGWDIVVLKLLGTPIQLHRFYLPLVLRGN